MTRQKEILDDKRIDELLITVNNIQENMATKEYVLESLKVNFKEYHDRFNPNSLVVMKPSGMTVSGEQISEEAQQSNTQASQAQGQPKKEGPLDRLDGWAKVAESGISLVKTLVVPARDPRFDAIENMSLDIVTNSVTGLVKRIGNEAMRSGATIHSGMTLDGHKD